MAASQDEVMRLVAEVVDKFSKPLKEMGSTLRQFGKTAGDSQTIGGKAAAEHAKQIKELREQYGKAKSFISDAMTPALASVGIAGFTAGEAIGKLAEKIKDAGESFKKFRETMERGHVSSNFAYAAQDYATRIGASTEKMREFIDSTGEMLDKLNRPTNFAERQRLQEAFPNLYPILQQQLQGVKSYEEAVVRIDKLLSDTNIPVDQRMKLADVLHADSQQVLRAGKEKADAWRAANKDAAAHAPDVDILKRLQESYSNLSVVQDNFWNDLIKLYGPAAAKAVDGVAHSVDHLGDAWKQSFKSVDRTSIFGRIAEKMGYPVGETRQDRINGAFAALNEKQTEETVAKGTTAGVLDALRQWSTDSNGNEAGLFANGLKPMAYHPISRGGYFGNKDYPALTDEQVDMLSGRAQVPKSLQDTGAAVNAWRSNPMGNGRVGTTFDRSRFATELEAKPWLKDKIFQLAAGEDRPSKGQSLAANQAVMETMMNRAVIRGTSLEDQARWYGREAGGYYAGHPSILSAIERANSESNLAKVLAGSNITDYATDNASGDLARREIASGRFAFHRNFNGESFFSPGWAEPKFRDRYARVREQMTREAQYEHGHGVASLRDHIRHRGGILKTMRQSGLFGTDAAKVEGNAALRIDLNGFPQGTKTKMSASGMFKEVKLNRGAVMPMANQDS